MNPTSITSEGVHIHGIWPHPAVIERNHFKFKSLSAFSYNTCVGCIHGCRFCYVPDSSTNWLASKLKAFGVSDPDADWGKYSLPRKLDEEKFMASLKKAEETPVDELPVDGNRAVMLSTTTDPYQALKDPEDFKAHQHNVRRGLELILDKSTLNVRILTRGPLAVKDFDVMESFGPRLLFGMSLPTLDNKLAKIYEPNAPSPAKRLETLRKAKEAGLHVYVALAPTYPECTEAGLRVTLEAIKQIEPVTIFHEPINIRAENVERISAHAQSLGITLNTEVFRSTHTWRAYAVEQLQLVERLAIQLGIYDRLHLWPDRDLDTDAARAQFPGPLYPIWLHHWWSRISEWPVIRNENGGTR